MKISSEPIAVTHPDGSRTLEDRGDMLYVCTTSEQGISVFRLPIGQLKRQAFGPPTHESPLVLEQIWRDNPSESSEYYRAHGGSRSFCSEYRYLPKLSADCRTVSWLCGPPFLDGEQVTFATLADGLPGTSAPQTHTRKTSWNTTFALQYTVRHPHLPAMYAQGVYDYDASLGVGIFGNAYGELALCNISGVDLKQLDRCLEKPHLPSVNGHNWTREVCLIFLPLVFMLTTCLYRDEFSSLPHGPFHTLAQSHLLIGNAAISQTLGQRPVRIHYTQTGP